MIKGKIIAIIGGGPGGLTLARLLQLKGANVTVYERDLNKDARVQGNTLDLHEESGLETLRQAGLIDAFYAAYRPGAGKMLIMDKAANVKMDNHTAGADYEETRPEIDRGPLRQILLGSLQPGTVAWNSQFVAMEPGGEGWDLQFKNGMNAYADIVIAADGANSKIRPYITPIKPFFAGVTMVEGWVHDSEKALPKMYSLLKGGKIFAFGDSRSIIVSAKGDGSFAFATGCNTDEYWVTNSGIDFNSKQQVVGWFKKEFAGWDGIWNEMIDKAEPYFVPRPQYCMPLDQYWEPLPNLTMIGDAAHLMPPYAGEGANMALADALELSVCLTSGEFESTRAAIRHYEDEMRKRAAEAAQMTLDSTALLHSPNAADNLVAMFNSFDQVNTQA